MTEPKIKPRDRKSTPDRLGYDADSDGLMGTTCIFHTQSRLVCMSETYD